MTYAVQINLENAFYNDFDKFKKLKVMAKRKLQNAIKKG
jgi:hypothetical protein